MNTTLVIAFALFGVSCALRLVTHILEIKDRLKEG
jgi:hypothetical protein